MSILRNSMRTIIRGLQEGGSVRVHVVGALHLDRAPSQLSSRDFNIPRYRVSLISKPRWYNVGASRQRLTIHSS
jgi:hypothetical protein